MWSVDEHLKQLREEKELTQEQEVRAAEVLEAFEGEDLWPLCTQVVWLQDRVAELEARLRQERLDREQREKLLRWVEQRVWEFVDILDDGEVPD